MPESSAELVIASGSRAPRSGHGPRFRNFPSSKRTETRDRLERYVRPRGLKKGFVIEQALLHHLLAAGEIPEDVVIPSRLVLGHEEGERMM